MSGMLSEAIKQAREQKRRKLDALVKEAQTTQEDITRLRGLLELFDTEGFYAFRQKFLKDIRLPQLYAASAKVLAADEKTRLTMAGQIAEAEAMVSSKIDLENELRGLTSKVDALDAQIAKERKRSDGKTGDDKK